jgi:hypothetical protein
MSQLSAANDAVSRSKPANGEKGGRGQVSTRLCIF